MLSFRRGWQTVQRNGSAAANASQRRLRVQKCRKEKEPSRLDAFAHRDRLRDHTHETDAWAFQTNLLKTSDSLLNEFIPIRLVECILRRGQAVNRPSVRSPCKRRLLEEIPISNEHSNHPRDCVYLSVNSTCFTRVKLQFHYEHELDLSITSNDARSAPRPETHTRRASRSAPPSARARCCASTPRGTASLLALLDP